jgi:hypothetical protein
MDSQELGVDRRKSLARCVILFHIAPTVIIPLVVRDGRRI